MCDKRRTCEWDGTNDPVPEKEDVPSVAEVLRKGLWESRNQIGPKRLGGMTISPLQTLPVTHTWSQHSKNRVTEVVS